MDLYTDKRVVLTLDAGGTNFVFNAIQSGKPMIEDVRLDSNAHDLDLCISTMKEGFHEVLQKISVKPVAISFAFPGPADYPNGIIGDLPNFPSFLEICLLSPVSRSTR